MFSLTGAVVELLAAAMLRCFMTFFNFWYFMLIHWGLCIYTHIKSINLIYYMVLRDVHNFSGNVWSYVWTEYIRNEIKVQHILSVLPLILSHSSFSAWNPNRKKKLLIIQLYPAADLLTNEKKAAKYDKLRINSKTVN